MCPVRRITFPFNSVSGAPAGLLASAAIPDSQPLRLRAYTSHMYILVNGPRFEWDPLKARKASPVETRTYLNRR